MTAGGAYVPDESGRTPSPVEHVEQTAAALYEHEMGRTTWPLPYADLTVTQQEKWRGEAYCAAYALARCPITGTVHPWLRSWCEPSCRETTPARTPASSSDLEVDP